MIIDGRAIAADVLARAKARAARLPHPPKVVAVVANETPATRSYLSIKAARAADAGCMLTLKRVPETADTETIRAAASDRNADAVIIQLPLPAAVDVQVACDAIPEGKDADVLGSVARAAFMRGDTDALLPPVVGAIAEVIARASVSVHGLHAVVIGSGYLVGAPSAAWLAQNGAQVTTVNQRSGDLASALGTADLVISGAGSAHLVTPELLKNGVVLIDAGTSESGGAITGDADPACAEKAAVFTPVPGGVGPIAVAKLFENATILAERKVSF